VTFVVTPNSLPFKDCFLRELNVSSSAVVCLPFMSTTPPPLDPLAAPLSQGKHRPPRPRSLNPEPDVPTLDVRWYVTAFSLMQHDTLTLVLLTMKFHSLHLGFMPRITQSAILQRFEEQGRRHLEAIVATLLQIPTRLFHQLRKPRLSLRPG
jgi:hypothetical protein